MRRNPSLGRKCKWRTRTFASSLSSLIRYQQALNHSSFRMRSQPTCSPFPLALSVRKWPLQQIWVKVCFDNLSRVELLYLHSQSPTDRGEPRSDSFVSNLCKMHRLRSAFLFLCRMTVEVKTYNLMQLHLSQLLRPL